MRCILIVVFLVLLSSTGYADEAQNQNLPKKCGLYAYAAEVTEVYDGDTITADIDLGFSVWRKDEKLRLWGIDAPEVRGEERPKGLISREALRERILGQQVIVCTIKDKTGKYGRYLAEIYLGDENINQWLLEQGLAQTYGDIVLGNVASLGAKLVMPEYVALEPPHQ